MKTWMRRLAGLVGLAALAAQGTANRWSRAVRPGRFPRADRTRSSVWGGCRLARLPTSSSSATMRPTS